MQMCPEESPQATLSHQQRPEALVAELVWSCYQLLFQMRVLMFIRNTKWKNTFL